MKCSYQITHNFSQLSNYNLRFNVYFKKLLVVFFIFTVICLQNLRLNRVMTRLKCVNKQTGRKVVDIWSVGIVSNILVHWLLNLVALILSCLSLDTRRAPTPVAGVLATWHLRIATSWLKRVSISKCLVWKFTMTRSLWSFEVSAVLKLVNCDWIWTSKWWNHRAWC